MRLPTSNSSVAVSRSCLIASDFLVVAITWNYTLRESRLRTRRILHRSLMTLLHVHGILYFLLMATLNILHLVLTLLSIFVTLDAVSEVVVFTDPLVAIVTWRFLLALQVANQGSEGLRTSSDVTADDSASLRFVRSSRLTGSVGGSLADNVAPHASRRFLGERETDDSDGSYPAMDTGEHLELKGNTDNEQGVQVVGRDGRLQRY
ncbi:hypothetical protein BV20DRAFT_831459 [Pilatotrama ljubarskyi]|nr:hypothetical protein BV20DRAFT_831459 [Pilatotrama ljubarskyi]